MVGSELGQVNEIMKHFKKLFTKRDNSNEIPNITPETMNPPFTGTEVYNNSCKLKNNKSPPDNVYAEMVKYAPIEISNEIANIYNIMAETGESADAIRRGILHPIPKPPKKDTKVNVRPISLLSVLRNILALCMIERCWDRMKQVIPKDQAAYQVGRSTTEQVFALKVKGFRYSE